MKEREAEVEAYCLAQVSRREQTAALHFVPASLRHGKAARAAPGRPYMVCILGMAEEASIAGRAVRMPHARMPRGVQDGVMTQMLLEVCCAHALRSEG